MSIDWMRQNDRSEMLKTSGIEGDDWMVSGSGEMPWHGTNVTVLTGNPTAEEALDAARLRWRVSKEPVYTIDYSGGQVAADPIPRYFAVVRDTDHKALGIVQGRYEPLQNEDAFAWANALLGGGINFETAGSLRGGRIVYVTAKTPFEVDLPGGDKLVTYLLISNRHDGRGTVTVAIITIRVVCKNTLSRSIQGALADVKIRHTVSLPTRMAQAQKVLGLAKGASDRAEEIATQLLATKLPEVKFQNFLDTLLNPAVDSNEEPGPREEAMIARKRSTIEEVYFTHPTQEEIRGTAWGAYNAVTFYNDHLTRRRNMEGDGTPADQRMLAIIGGNNLGDKALDILRQEVAVS